MSFIGINNLKTDGWGGYPDDFLEFIYNRVIEKKPKVILDFGTGWGYITSALAQGIRDLNNGGKVITYDHYDDDDYLGGWKHDKNSVINNLEKNNLHEYVDIVSIDVFEWLNNPIDFDLAFIDIHNNGDKLNQIFNHPFLKKAIENGSEVLFCGGSPKRDNINKERNEKTITSIDSKFECIFGNPTQGDGDGRVHSISKLVGGNKKLAVVACGWHYSSEFYKKMIEQKIPTGWEVDYFCVSHRNPKFAWEEKKNKVDNIITDENNDNLFQLIQRLDKKMYSEEVNVDKLNDMGWNYIEKPNTIGGWGAHNQWLDDYNYKDYDAFFFSDDDLYFFNDVLFEDILSNNHFEWDEWLVISNGKNLDPDESRITLRGSSEFFKKEMLDIMGGKFDLGNPTLFREGESYTPDNPESALGDWNCVLYPMANLIKEHNISDKIKFLSPYYRVSAYWMDTERGFFSGVGYSNMVNGLNFMYDKGILNG
jgi:hypothetical protein